MPALPGPPPRASTPSVRGGAGNAARKDKDERHEGDGDFGEFPEVGLLGPAAVLGERSPREVAHKPSAVNHSARVG